MVQSADSRVTISPENPTKPEVLALLRDGEEWSAARYPSESNHHLSESALLEPNVRFLVGRDIEGNAVATGAIVIHQGWAELKAMWVKEDVRGRGISKAILANLEFIATREAVRWLKLETGNESHEAIGLYSKAGFIETEPFGDYKPDPLSVFMEKDLQKVSR